MIKAYKTKNNQLVETLEFEQDSWISTITPTEKELNKLLDHFELPNDFFFDSLDPDEIARMEIEDNAMLIIFRIPIYNSENEDIPYSTMPIGIIIIFDKLLITVSQKSNEFLNDILQNKIKNFNTHYRDKMILQMFNKSINLYLRYLKQIGNKLNLIEDQIKTSMKNEDLIKLYNYEKIMINFRSSLKANNRLIQKLQNSTIFTRTEHEKNLLEDIIIDNKQAYEMADIYSNILNEMMTFFSSLISNNLNLVMKFLTSITIIVAIPTLISSIYGMNIPLPFQHSEHSFIIIMSLSLSAIIAGVLFFVYRKWM